MGVEIERKYLIDKDWASKFYEMAANGILEYHDIEQVYLTVDPVIRVRKSDDEYYMTYKGKGKMIKEEYNLPLTEESYNILSLKGEGNIITKRRVLIPLNKYYADVASLADTNPFGHLVVELDYFKRPVDLIMAEVEFASEEECNNFVPPVWFLEEVTGKKEYYNSFMSRMKIE